MRFFLVDASRRKASKMRGGGEILVTFDESLSSGSNFHVGPEFLALDAALNSLASVAPRQAQLLEARFFGGLTAEEMVEIFGISQSTVVRELRMAKAWVSREVRPPMKGLPEQ
jgi:DNA-directed RNA polymerase specialized sigma24 family protein